MKMIPLRSLKILLLSLFAASLNLSATFWQVPEESIHCSYRLGHIQVLHDDDTGWSIIDNDGCPIQVEDCFVDQNIRYIENEDLFKVLGFCEFDLAATDLETNETVAAYRIQTSGYLNVTLTEDGNYAIRFYVRGPGGGPVAGVVAGVAVKAVGYTAICVFCGPVGWAAAGTSIAWTVGQGLFGWGLGKAAKAAKAAGKLSELAKATKALEKSERAVAELTKAVSKSSNAKRLKKLADAVEKLNKARATVKQIQAASAGGLALKSVEKVLGANDKIEFVKNSVELGKQGAIVEKAAAAGGKVLVNPLVAGVDILADVAQFIGDFTPLP